MSVICPAVLAQTEKDYFEQMDRISTFARRVQIDLMDGDFASPKSVGLDEVWWPDPVTADLHIMYRRPMSAIDKLIALSPSMVIIHAEAEVDHMHFAAELHKTQIKAGLAVLPETSIASVEPILRSFDHLLIFSGHLGHFGGQADLELLKKAQEAKTHHPTLEIGWDGGVNQQNAHQLANGGVDVLNVGGFVQNNSDPAQAYAKLKELAG